MVPWSDQCFMFQVCQQWLAVAATLNLQPHIPQVSRENTWLPSLSHSAKLAKIFHIWRKENPGSFTVRNLLTILRKLELQQAEVWVRILTAHHYQHIRASSFSQLSSSLDSLTGDSGVTDLSQSFSSDLESARSQAQSWCHNTQHSDSVFQSHFLFTFLYLCSDSHTEQDRCGPAKSSRSLHKWKSETTLKSSTKFRYITKVKAGSVFDTLFKPEGKALAKISQAWMAQMKEKKRRCCGLQSFHQSGQTVGPISIEKYFDNLVSILYQSTSSISI